jgi:hypothetical protein
MQVDIGAAVIAWFLCSSDFDWSLDESREVQSFGYDTSVPLIRSDSYTTHVITCLSIAAFRNPLPKSRGINPLRIKSVLQQVNRRLLGSDESSREPTGRWRGLYAIAALGGEPEKAGRPWLEANDQIFIRAKGSQSGPCRAH